jgi:hypothetical protein
MTRKELWNENLQFYQELVTKYDWDQQPMIELIQRFETVGLCKKFFPSNSHEALGLSRADNYEQRLLLPMVYITYQSKTNTFKLTFQKGQGKTINEENCGPHIDSQTISKIEDWLLKTN